MGRCVSESVWQHQASTGARHWHLAAAQHHSPCADSLHHDGFRKIHMTAAASCLNSCVCAVAVAAVQLGPCPVSLAQSYAARVSGSRRGTRITRVSRNSSEQAMPWDVAAATLHTERARCVHQASTVSVGACVSLAAANAGGQRQQASLAPGTQGQTSSSTYQQQQAYTSLQQQLQAVLVSVQESRSLHLALPQGAAPWQWC